MRKRKKSQRPAPTTAGLVPGASAATPTGVDSMMLGVANVTRRFRLDENSTPTENNMPTYIMNKISPMACFIQGWADSKTSDADGGFGDALSLDDSTVKDVLYPRTPYAEHWSEVIWPIVLNLFEAGVGSRYKVSQPEVIRYFAHACFAYAIAYSAVVNNMMTYRFDWTLSLIHISEPTRPY